MGAVSWFYKSNITFIEVRKSDRYIDIHPLNILGPIQTIDGEYRFRSDQQLSQKAQTRCAGNWNQGRSGREPWGIQKIIQNLWGIPGEGEH